MNQTMRSIALHSRQLMVDDARRHLDPVAFEAWYKKFEDEVVGRDSLNPEFV